MNIPISYFSKSDWISIIGVLFTAAITFLLFYFGRKLTFENKQKRIDTLIKRMSEHIKEAKRGTNIDTNIINIRRYKEYPFGEGKTWKGWQETKGELKDLRFNGVEFFTSPDQIYINNDGEFTLTKTKNKAKDKITKVGFIPYEKIAYYRYEGDEYSENRPVLYTKFKLIGGMPYISYRFYKKDKYMFWQEVKVK